MNRSLKAWSPSAMLFLGIVGRGFNTWEMEKDTQVLVKPQQVCSLGGRRCPQDASSLSVCDSGKPGSLDAGGPVSGSPCGGKPGLSAVGNSLCCNLLGGGGSNFCPEIDPGR